MYTTPIHPLVFQDGRNRFFIKRDDLLPFSFGGNKVRKALLHFEYVDAHHHTAIVTVGSATSNHCRIVANMAAQRRLPCIIVSPEESEKPAFNRTLTQTLNARVVLKPKDRIDEAVDVELAHLKRLGHNPYYIRLGGHGMLGTEAYARAYNEIVAHEKAERQPFDAIFFADGTGTTHAGLVCGKRQNHRHHHIIGISVLREVDAQCDIVTHSVNEYLDSHDIPPMKAEAVHCIGDYAFGGYGKTDPELYRLIRTVMETDGIALDPVYTAKAFYGMVKEVAKRGWYGKNVLFLHTGGAPIFFDALAAGKLNEEDPT